jgi:hypothetical protein
MLRYALPRHAFLSEDGYEVVLPHGYRAVACRTFLSGYAMTIRAYFDGSGTEDDSACDLLTLVGMAAPLTAWDHLEDRWAKVLWKHNVCKSHMVDCISRRSDFSPDRGWNESRQNLFIGDLEQALVEFGNQPDVHYSITSVDMKAYRHVKAQMPTISVSGSQEPYPKASTLCAFYCLNFLCWRWDSEPFELFFDRGEAFYDKLYRPWNNKRTLSDPRLKRVTRMSIGSTDFDLPLQASDYFAWHVNRMWTKNDKSSSDRLSSLCGGSSFGWTIHELTSPNRIKLALTGTYDV